MSVVLGDAAQVLRPPEDGLPYLREDALVAAPGSVTLDGGVVAGFDGGSSADVVVDATGCAVVPGWSGVILAWGLWAITALSLLTAVRRLLRIAGALRR